MSAFYPKGAAHILGDPTKIDLIADDIDLLFYSGAYNAAHEVVDDLTGASIIARSGHLAGKSVALGVFDTNNITVLTVAGAPFAHTILFKNDADDDALSLLIAMFDHSTFTPNGGNVNVVMNASGLFAI